VATAILSQEPRSHTRFVNERPGVRYFSVSSVGSSGGVAYDYDAHIYTYKTISVTAIYGLVEPQMYTESIVLGGCPGSYCSHLTSYRMREIGWRLC
jgi:hypothetical protein